MKVKVNADRVLYSRNPMIYGQFLEHFHRQIYGGIYDPANPLSDADGFREDVLEALRQIRVPIIRWPGGCYVSAYHWEYGVGKERIPHFDKAWRLEDDNSFGTDEFVLLCRKLGCEPYICTNAGSGTQEEMSNWVEYCNLPGEGQYARKRIAGGHAEPFRVKYWSVGNENYLDGEMGSKTAGQWGPFVREAAKMMKRVDPGIELSAASIADVEWNVSLLKNAGRWLQWISIHGYWDELWQENSPATYTQCMARTEDLDRDVRKVRGLLNAFGLEKQIRIAYDEWNLRGWHHPRVDVAPLGETAFLEARNKNDENSTYTMADAVFSACFLNMLLRNADLVGMANFAPTVNTRGMIFTCDRGIVLRPTYYVFELYTREMGDEVIDCFPADIPQMEAADRFGKMHRFDQVDIMATRHSTDGRMAVSMINKHPSEAAVISLDGFEEKKNASMKILTGSGPDAFNDIGITGVQVKERNELLTREPGGKLKAELPPCSVCLMTAW